MKTALITGISGQDGAYLANLLLNKGYRVIGGERRNASSTLWRLNELGIHNDIELVDFELSESTNILRVIDQYSPNEVYNLAAQSFVGASFELPTMTADITGLGVSRLLEAIRHINKDIKFYQASSSEMYGKVQQTPQDENTPFYPRSPYGVAKLYSYWITVNYRESYNIFACNGILFNHESPLRGETFVTKKIVRALCRIKNNRQKKLFLGNLYSKRDWGHAEDYVIAMWKMLQLKKPQDFVICTGKQYSIKDFINIVSKQLNYPITWKGKGIKEKGYNYKKQCVIEIHKKYFRPAEVDSLKGSFKKAKKILKWKPKHNINSLIKDMVDYELNNIDNDFKRL